MAVGLLPGSGIHSGTPIAISHAVRILEARFHPFEHGNPTFVVVCHIVWDVDDKGVPRVEPTVSLQRQTGSASMLATIRHLVSMTTPRTFERLQTLKSRFWSFVSVHAILSTTETK